MNTIHLVCPHCNTTNRVQDDKLQAELSCGRCHSTLLAPAPDNLNEAAFTAQLTKSQLPLVVDFWAPWCGPCRREIPDLVTLSSELAPKGVVVVGVSVDDNDDRLRTVKNFVEKSRITYMNVIDNDNKDIARHYGVQSIPMTLVIDRQGKIVEKIIGARSKDAFMAALARAM